jgi:purine nucleosidase
MRKIIIDTDPGQDDAVAILAALASPEDFDVLGICSVAGNVPLHHTTRNTLQLVELAGSEVAVYAGCSRPMVKDLVTAEYVHGPTGLDGADLPAPRRQPEATHAVDFLVETLLAAEPESVTLCTLGPLTNIAMALVRAPEIAGAIDGIVAMGGGFFEGGNVTPAAEFNIYVDPHAAHVVFTSGIPITLMPLDVTHQALAGEARVVPFRELGTAAGDSVAGMLAFFDRHDMEKYGSEGAPLHDPTTVAYLIDPGLFTGRMCHVEIVRDGPAEGMTMVDWWRVTGNEPNAMVINEVDADGFFAVLLERIARL